MEMNSVSNDSLGTAVEINVRIVAIPILDDAHHLSVLLCYNLALALKITCGDITLSGVR